MSRRIFAIIILLCLLCGCQNQPSQQTPKVYEASFLTLFDTVTTIKGTAESKEAFQQTADRIHDQLEHYHQLFDIYHDYEGLNNLKTVNDQAGIAPVAVEQPIIALLTDCARYYELTSGKVNVAMGSVLRLWHDARTAGINDPSTAALPSIEKLQAASVHTDFSSIVIDAENATVYISDPEIQLDVGAVAKGWAAQQVTQTLPEGILLSVGGNVCATGPKYPDTPWVIGVEDPDSSDYVHTLYVSGGSIVTSGDYQRAYTVDGKMYHHIIDPQTLMPSAYWRSVTVVCPDSGLADALSTALFLMPLEQGQQLAQDCGAEVLWLNAAGEEFMTPGFGDMIKR